MKYYTKSVEDLKKLKEGEIYFLVWDLYNARVIVQCIRKYSENKRCLVFAPIIINDNNSVSDLIPGRPREWYHTSESSYFIDIADAENIKNINDLSDLNGLNNIVNEII